MDSLNIPAPGIMPPPAIVDYLQAPSIGMRPTGKEGQSFSEVLQQAMLPSNVEVQFSGHAKARMKSRGIELNPEDMVKLNDGINKAKAKGAHEALILLNGNAFVVNIENRTVVTALNQAETKGGVFTQIDSTVLMG
jgi:flagellar operon protein